MASDEQCAIPLSYGMKDCKEHITIDSEAVLESSMVVCIWANIGDQADMETRRLRETSIAGAQVLV
jgi:hypothetical protein